MKCKYRIIVIISLVFIVLKTNAQNPITGTGVATQVPFFTSGSNLTSVPDLTFNNSLKMFTVGTLNDNTTRLTVNGAIKGNGNGGGLLLIDGSNNQIFRGLVAGFGLVSTNHTYFQVGSSGRNVAFTGVNGSRIPKTVLLTDSFQVSNGTNVNTPNPVGLFELRTATAPLFNVLTTGNVGIGTTTPVEKLEVNGNVKATSFIKSGGTRTQYLMADGSVSTGPTGESLITPGTTTQYWRGDKTWQTLDKTAVGLVNVDNTSDGAKPISTATQTALDAKQNTLVSGTNIKTINGNSLLGSGDLVISGGGSLVDLTSNQTIAGTKTFSADGYFNGIQIGKGASNYISNTVIGNGASVGTNEYARNTAIGYNAGKYMGGSANTFLGNEAGRGNATQSTGYGNVGIGSGAGFRLGGGNGSNYNTMVGSGAGSNITLGSGNTVIGSGAASSLTTGENNIAIGNSSFSGSTTSTNSIAIGNNAFPSGNGTNQIVIGNNATGAGSNTATLGNTSITKTILRGEVQGGSFKKVGGLSTEYLMADGSVSTSTNSITSTGTSNYISKFTASGMLSNSAIYDTGGNVGIGTTSPDAKLAVKGQIHTQEVKVDLQGAMVPDYVFASDYKLISLEEVEKYIKENKHLPEIPSAVMIEKEGLFLKEMNLNLLKKIEELTLYVITQHKEIEGLKKENEKYKSLSDRLSALEQEHKKIK